MLAPFVILQKSYVDSDVKVVKNLLVCDHTHIGCLMLQNSTAAFHVDRKPLAALPPLALCPDALIRSTIAHSLNVLAFALVRPDFVLPHMCSMLKADNIDLEQSAQKVGLKSSHQPLSHESWQGLCLCW